MNLPTENPPVTNAETNEVPLTPQQIDMRHANTLLERAFNHAERGEMDKALLACRQAVHLTPQSFAGHSLLAMLLRRDDEITEAIVYSEKALALLPDQQGEKERLSLLLAARDKAENSVPLQYGEWDKYRLELQREIKLSQMLEAQMADIPPLTSNEPLPFANDPLLAAPNPLPEVSPVFEPSLTPREPASATASKPSQNYFILLSLAALAALLSFFFVRNMQQKTPANQPAPTTQVTSSTTSQPSSDLIPQSQQPTPPAGATSPAAPPANSPVTPATATQVSPPARPQPVEEPRIPAVQNAPQVDNSAPASRQTPATRPPVISDVPPNTSRTSIPARSPIVNNEAPPVRTRPPVREEEVGPRFSTPEKATEESSARPQKNSEDVGPRFSQP